MNPVADTLTDADVVAASRPGMAATDRKKAMTIAAWIFIVPARTLKTLRQLAVLAARPAVRL